MEVKKVFEGWKNLLVPSKELKEQIQTVRDERMGICSNCPYYSKNIDASLFKYCTLCGCPIKAKTSCLSCTCGALEYNAKHPEDQKPIRWEAVVTDEEEDSIEELLKNNQDEEKGL